MPTNVSISEKTYRELWKVKEELEKELGVDLSLHRTIQYLMKFWKEYKKTSENTVKLP